MAKDGIRVHFSGGAKLDRALARMAVTHQSETSKVVTQSLSAGATVVKNAVKNEAPTRDTSKHGDTKGFKTKSRNTTIGQLKRSIKSGLRNKVKVSRSSFVAGVWLQTKYGGAPTEDDGFYGKFVLEKHNPNPFGGYTGGNDFLTRGVKKGEAGFRKKVGQQLGRKIAALNQKIIDGLK